MRCFNSLRQLLSKENQRLGLLLLRDDGDGLLAGVGGQGILSIAFVIEHAAMDAGFNFKQAEVHGMAQRGGAVQSNHCRLTLAAAVKEGLKCRLILEERVPGSYNPESAGNNFLFRLMGVEKIKVVPGSSDMIAEMQAVADEVAGQGYMGENAEDLKLVGPSLSSDHLGFIYPKGSEIVDPVNQALSAMKADGFLQELSTKYFGPTFTITYDDLE